MSEAWGADVPISQPKTTEAEVKVNFDGFGFSMGGLVFATTSEELEEIFTPTFMPEGYQDDDLIGLPVDEGQN